MMDMQEIKERRRGGAAAARAPAEDVEEVDPTVESSASLLPRERRQGTLEKGVSAVLARAWSIAFFTVALFGLYELEFIHEVLYAPAANRPFMHLFVLFSTLVVGLGAYIELYRSLLRGETVRYESAKTSTHGMLLSMIAAGFCFTVGMWPVWHWLTVPYLFMWFWGTIVQAVVLFPIQVQRVFFAVVYLWFMHAYLRLVVV